ncbi:hypothetical protein [Microbacterium lacticum]|uniref:hypothetical protein n=1 Tax=Microbacterium lacticum TaxID=33885 RepID=UPI001F57FFC7|nr:hypothetical protein [Microbacterium lacticum]
MTNYAPLWKLAEVNPLTPEFQDLDEGVSVSFMPLETIWPGGRADYSRSISWSKKLSYTTFRRGDVLVPKITPTFEAGRSIIAQIPTGLGVASTEVHVVRTQPGVDSRFVTYSLQSAPFLDEGAHSLQGVGNLRRITPRFVQEHQLLDAPAETQKRIADYLDRETGEIDAMLAKMDELTTTLASRRAAAVDQSLECSFGNHMAPIWALLSPVKEQNHPMEEVLSVYRDFGVIPKSSRDDNNNRTPKDLTSYQLVLVGDLVINKMKAWQGSLGVSNHRGIVSPDYQVARPRVLMDSRFLHAVLRSPRMIPQYRVRSTGVRPSQWRLYWEDFADLMVPMPPLAEQTRIADHLDEVTGKIDHMLAKTAELKSLLIERRSALITDVVTGKKQVHS